MCRQRTCGNRRTESRDTPAHPREYNGAYEGQTIQLNAEQAVATVHHTRRCSAFPWWTLWLIWPLFGGIKAVTAALPSTLLALTGLWQQIGLSVLAIVLIATGVWLIYVHGDAQPRD